MMKIKSIAIIIPFILFSLSIVAQHSGKDTFLLYYLGGQSNMDGYGQNNDLPAHLKSTFDKVWIFHGNSLADENPGGGTGVWDKLQPGHGVGFSATKKGNNLSNRYGVELSFAHSLLLDNPKHKVALIKYSRGGTSIDSLAGAFAGSWEADFHGNTGINQYDHFLATIRNAYQDHDINNDGKEDLLIPKGIIWMQGESDAAINEDIASRYYFNLKRLMDLIRASFRIDDLPVVIGKISDSHKSTPGKLVWAYGDLVMYAQEKYVKTDQNAIIVRSTDKYGYSDPWHYDSEGYIDLGTAFAEAIIKLQK